MALAFDGSPRTDASGGVVRRTPRPIATESVGRPGAEAEPGRRFARQGEGVNTITASQARAARRREARRDQQAVASWLRELSRK